MKIPDWAAKKLQSALQGNAAVAFFRLFMGRCTFFAIAFSAVGCYGWLVKGRDLTSFAMFAGAIQGLLLAHSYKEDVAAQKQTQTQTVDINIQK
jgi:hypothetical protein